MLTTNLTLNDSFLCVLQEKPKMFAKGTEINTTVVVKKLNEILQARGKKGTDRYSWGQKPPWCTLAHSALTHLMATTK